MAEKWYHRKKNWDKNCKTHWGHAKCWMHAIEKHGLNFWPDKAYNPLCKTDNKQSKGKKTY